MEHIEAVNEEDKRILADIEDRVIDNIKLGYDPRVLEVLDDDNAASSRIENLKNQITEEIVVRLFRMSNAVYYGRLMGGKVSTFFDVVMRLGMQPAKLYILALSIFSASTKKEFRMLSAQSFATSVISRMIAHEMGLHDKEVKKAESGGLFFDMGKIIMCLYRMQQGSEYTGEEFITNYNSYLGIKIIEKFSLPDFLKGIIHAPFLRFVEDSFHLSAVVSMAHSVAEQSFKKSGRFIIQSPMPDSEGRVANTPGSIISDQFRAIGLGEYVKVVEEENQEITN